jgi:ankyrin repeat protein
VDQKIVQQVTESCF